MPDIPRHLKTVTPKPVGRAPLPVGAADIGESAKAAGLGVLGRGVSDLGNVLLQIEKEQIAASDAISETKADSLIKASKVGFEQYKKDEPLILGRGGSPSNWQSEDTDRRLKLSDSILNNQDLPLSQRARERMEATLDAHGTLSESLTRYDQSVTLNKNERAALLVGLEQAYASNDPLMIERMELRWEREGTRLYGSDTAARNKAYQNARASGQEAGAEAAVENIKPFLIDAIGVNNKSEDGYRVLDAAIEQLVEDGVLTKPEGAEANKKLGDWIDNYVSGRIKAAKEADKLSTIQSYQELSKPILDGKLTYEDIENSDLRETRRTGEQTSDADKWRKYIKGSYKDAPTKNKPEGLENSFDAVYGVTTLQVSPKEGYDILLQARFVDKSITNDQFEWAVNKIENPYSRYQLEDLNATMKSNRDDFDRDGFHRSLFPRVVPDQERNKRVNEALISWYDEQIENGKPPSKKEMEAKSASFRTGGAVPSDIGAVIPQGGWNWEIIGYDENGEPLVDNPTPIGGEIP